MDFVACGPLPSNQKGQRMSKLHITWYRCFHTHYVTLCLVFIGFSQESTPLTTSKPLFLDQLVQGPFEVAKLQILLEQLYVVIMLLRS